MYWPNLKADVRHYTKTCRACQFGKKRKLQYGKLPEKFVVTNPWEVLCVDLIGPYTLKGQDGSALDFMCLTMIDPATSWFEMAELPCVEKPVVSYIENGHKRQKILTESVIIDKTSKQIARLVNKLWFSRYPRCQKIIYDNGSEFKLYFQSLCDSYGIKQKPTTIKNPQANAILERVHQVIGQMLHTSGLDMAPTADPEAVSDFLDDASWAICSTYHTVLKSSPGAVIFGWDMLFDIPYVS